MRHDSNARHARAAGVLAMLAAAPCAAQPPAEPAAPAASATSSVAAAPTAPTTDDVAALARLAVAIAEVRDSAHKQLALGRNKTPQAQQQLREQAAVQVAALLRAARLSEAEYRRRTYLVSTDSAARRVYDEAVARLTGMSAPGAPEAPGERPAAPAASAAPASGAAAP